MAASGRISLLLTAGAVAIVISTYPYLATAIAYRDSDNGLAYIMLIMGVGIWNGMFAAQILGSSPLVDGFFLALSMVGAALAGLGWFLFASTASSTPEIPRSYLVYGGASLLVGLDITLTVTSFTHSLYWEFPAEDVIFPTFASIYPHVGYWFHTLLLISLFGTGAALFLISCRKEINLKYSRGYTVCGIATAGTVAVSNVLYPGSVTIAPLVAGALTTVGWMQAEEKRPGDALLPSW